MPPALFIFDVDGVLRDSSGAALEGMRRGFRNAGIEIPYDRTQYRLIRSVGKYNNSERCLELMLALRREDERPERIVSRAGPGSEQAFDAMVAKHIHEADRGLIARVRAAYKEFSYSPDAKPFVSLLPGVPEALDQLRKKECGLAIWTNSGRVTVERDLGPYLDRFMHVLGGEDFKIKKPAPDGILAICRDLGVRPEDAAYVGDAAVDVQAAKAANATSIVLLSEVANPGVLRREKADYYFRDLRELADSFAP